MKKRKRAFIMRLDSLTAIEKIIEILDTQKMDDTDKLIDIMWLIDIWKVKLNKMVKG